jgi:Subtilase family
MKLSGRVLLTVVLSCLIGGSAAARPPLRGVGNAYIIGVKPDQVKSSQAAADDIAARSHGIVGRVWEGVHAFEIEIDDAEAARISTLPFVDYVEMDREMPFLDTARESVKADSLPTEAGLVSAFGWHPTPLFASACASTQTSTPSADRTLGWGLDRIDARTGLDGTYHYGHNDGTGVDVFIVATGILSTHEDFQPRNGRARLKAGYSSVNDGRGTDDCNGFGTRVASFAAGDYAGVAKGADIISRRALCRRRRQPRLLTRRIPWPIRGGALETIALNWTAHATGTS